MTSGMTRSTVAFWLHDLSTALGALVFPWSCARCGMEGATGPWCETCRELVIAETVAATKSVCPRCALQVGPYADLHGGCASCRGRSLGFDTSIAMGPYEGELRELCLRLKHEENAWLAVPLAEFLVEARHDAFRSLPGDTLVVPVPLYWWRYWRRGYNQAEALADGVAKRLKLPMCRSLERVVGTRKLRAVEPYCTR